jgi:hypothetical protein
MKVIHLTKTEANDLIEILNEIKRSDIDERSAYFKKDFETTIGNLNRIIGKIRKVI